MPAEAVVARISVHFLLLSNEKDDKNLPRAPRAKMESFILTFCLYAEGGDERKEKKGQG